MRDWLALPITDTLTQPPIEEPEEEQEDKHVSGWFSLLAAFGLSSKLKRNTQSRSIVDSIDTQSAPVMSKNETLQLIVSNSSDIDTDMPTEMDNTEEIILIEEESLEAQSIQKHYTEIDHEEDTCSHDDVPSRRSSISSTISTTDTDNSTPAQSEIIDTKCNQENYMNEAMNQLMYHNVPTVKIQWKHGGKSVQITGEFDNWSASINMVHDTAKPGVYLAEIPVNTKEDMEYKFVVDGEWRYAADLPHRTDRHGNINNVIYKQELPTL